MTRPRYRQPDNDEDRILRHMLSLDEFNDKPRPRHYLSEHLSNDWHTLRSLEKDQMVYGVRSPSFVPENSRTFVLTALGKARAQSAHSRAKPKLTRGQKRYRDYLAADCSETFMEWLKLEANRKRREREGLPPYPSSIAWLYEESA